MAELKNYNPPWRERIPDWLTDQIFGENATRDNRALMGKLAGHENPFNLPAHLEMDAEQIGRGAQAVGQGNIMSGMGDMAMGTASAAMNVGPFAGVGKMLKMRNKAAKHPRQFSSEHPAVRASEFAKYMREKGLGFKEQQRAGHPEYVNRSELPHGNSFYVRGEKGKVRFSDHFANANGRNMKQRTEAFPEDNMDDVLNRYTFGNAPGTSKAYSDAVKLRKASEKEMFGQRSSYNQHVRALMPSKKTKTEATNIIHDTDPRMKDKDIKHQAMMDAYDYISKYMRGN